MKKAIKALDNIQEKMVIRRRELESGKTRLARVSPQTAVRQKDSAVDSQKRASK